MAQIHRATLTPSKPELVAEWLASQAAVDPGSVEVLAAYRFDDPAGEVGVEVFLLDSDQGLHQVPLSYRSKPLPGAHTFATLDHSVLGTRHVADGATDPVFWQGLALLAATGVGQAALVVSDDRLRARPPAVLLRSVGWETDAEEVRLDGWSEPAREGDLVTVGNEDLELTLSLRPGARVPGRIQVVTELSGRGELVLAGADRIAR